LGGRTERDFPLRGVFHLIPAGARKVSPRRSASRVLLGWGVLGLALLPAGCARAPQGPENVSAFRQVGEASWYGPDFHGRLTASGERYNMLSLTAAHRDLPFNTLVRVTNLDNGREVVVRINDRGPFLKGRILDLSYGAARALGANRPGVVRVRIEVVGKAAPPAPAKNQGGGKG
jgi:rare lipoprotein A (peptidoglycan hydrolase)